MRCIGFRSWLAIASLLYFTAVPVWADSESRTTHRSGGQLVYVSAYSHVYTLDAKRKLNLSVTLSIRNTDLNDALTVHSARYYNSQGELVREYVEAPVSLPPLATIEHVVARRDETGGSGANFLVEWSADTPVSPPAIEALMVSAGAGANALAFVRSGQVLEERTGPN